MKNLYPPIKRFFDFLFALVATLLLLPILLPIALFLKFSGEGEVLYLQKRVGYRNRYFHIWKFATMLKNSPNMKGGEITLRNYPRITALGRYLRITKLNELPQIINVLKGDMSFVGPRPLMQVSFDQYSPKVQAKVYNSRPGITGIGSIIFRDEEKMVTESGMEPREFYQKYIFPYKGAVEMWYQNNQSFYVDLMILLLTAWAIFFPETNLHYKVFRDLPERPKALVLS